MMEVARLVGRSFGTVQRHLHAAGVEIWPRGSSRRPRPRQVPHSEMIRTAQLYQSGLSMAQVADVLGMHPSGVRRRLDHAGVPRRSWLEANRLAGLRNPRRLAADVEECLVVLYRLDIPLDEITRWMGVTRSTVTRVAKRNGVPLRQPRECAVRSAEQEPESTKIDNAPLRRAFEASSVTATQVALRLDWHQRGQADTSRVLRTLGLMPDINHGYQSYRSKVCSRTAALFADAMGLDPWEVEA